MSKYAFREKLLHIPKCAYKEFLATQKVFTYTVLLGVSTMTALRFLQIIWRNTSCILILLFSPHYKGSHLWKDSTYSETVINSLRGCSKLNDVLCWMNSLVLRTTS